MNPDIKIIPFLDKVGPDTENKYSDSFFQGTPYLPPTQNFIIFSYLFLDFFLIFFSLFFLYFS